MLVALSAQRYPLPFQNFLHTRQARSDHRVVQRFADHARQVQPQLSPRGFPSILALGTLVHGGLLLLPNPIFRSGEECRHSNLNNLQDIAALYFPTTQLNYSNGINAAYTILVADTLIFTGGASININSNYASLAD